MNIILASGSPRRKELLKIIFSDFEVKPSGADETLPENISPDRASEFLAVKKAEFIKRNSDDIVIGCDTTVVINNRILGKPKDSNDCKQMLEELSGTVHYVYTGVSVISDSFKLSFTEKTEVEFYCLSDEEINNYIQTGEPFDKAGGYGIQGKGSLLVKSIKGDYFNVVGLPLSRLNRKLKKYIL